MTATVGPPLGLETPEEVRRTCINGTGAVIAIGDVVMLDLAASVATTFDVGATTSTRSVVVVPNASGLRLQYSIFGVAVTSAPDNQRVDVVFRGRVNALLGTVLGAVSGEGLAPVGGSPGLDEMTGVIGLKVIAIAVTAGSTGDIILVDFDGINGFGFWA